MAKARKAHNAVILLDDSYKVSTEGVKRGERQVKFLLRRFTAESSVRKNYAGESSSSGTWQSKLEMAYPYLFQIDEYEIQIYHDEKVYDSYILNQETFCGISSSKPKSSRSSLSGSIKNCLKLHIILTHRTITLEKKFKKENMLELANFFKWKKVLNSSLECREAFQVSYDYHIGEKKGVHAKAGDATLHVTNYSISLTDCSSLHPKCLQHWPIKHIQKSTPLPNSQIELDLDSENSIVGMCILTFSNEEEWTTMAKVFKEFREIKQPKEKPIIKRHRSKSLTSIRSKLKNVTRTDLETLPVCNAPRQSQKQASSLECDDVYGISLHREKEIITLLIKSAALSLNSRDSLQESKRYIRTSINNQEIENTDPVQIFDERKLLAKEEVIAHAYTLMIEYNIPIAFGKSIQRNSWQKRSMSERVQGMVHHNLKPMSEYHPMYEVFRLVCQGKEDDIKPVLPLKMAFRSFLGFNLIPLDDDLGVLGDWKGLAAHIEPSSQFIQLIEKITLLHRKIPLTCAELVLKYWEYVHNKEQYELVKCSVENLVMILQEIGRADLASSVQKHL